MKELVGNILDANIPNFPKQVSLQLPTLKKDNSKPQLPKLNLPTLNKTTLNHLFHPYTNLLI